MSTQAIAEYNDNDGFLENAFLSNLEGHREQICAKKRMHAGLWPLNWFLEGILVIKVFIFLKIAENTKKKDIVHEYSVVQFLLYFCLYNLKTNAAPHCVFLERQAKCKRIHFSISVNIYVGIVLARFLFIVAETSCFNSRPSWFARTGL